MKIRGSGLCSFIMQKDLSDWINTAEIRIDNKTAEKISRPIAEY